MEKRDQVVTILGGIKKPRWAWWVAVTAGGCVLVMGAWAWWLEQQRPITLDQREELRRRVEVAMIRTGRSRQDLWWEAKRELGVRRVEEIRRGDLGQAKEILDNAAE